MLQQLLHENVSKWGMLYFVLFNSLNSCNKLKLYDFAGNCCIGGFSHLLMGMEASYTKSNWGLLHKDSEALEAVHSNSELTQEQKINLK